MLKIKLAPTGKKHEPHYRLVVVEEHSKLTGRPVAEIGHFHPKSKELVIDRPLLEKWVGHGAQPTDRVRRLLHL